MYMAKIIPKRQCAAESGCKNGETRMPCFSPLKGYVSKELTVNGKRKTVFDSRQAGDFGSRTLPCGQCIGCKLERSRQWAIRISHEASLYQQNCFITLTYAPEHLPPDGSLDVRHFQLFMKRLRKKYGKNIRFFHCGEYGEQLGRPHYHACLLNFDFPDKCLRNTTPRGDHVYSSNSLSSLWPYGRSEVGTVTFESAAYVARYVTKKITGPLAATHYSGKRPEYTTMSRKPGIGTPWLDRFKTDIYPHDFVIVRGKKVPLPRYYNKQFENEYPALYEVTKTKRCAKRFGSDWLSKEWLEENTDDRLRVKETVQLSTANAALGRKYETNKE